MTTKSQIRLYGKSNSRNDDSSYLSDEFETNILIINRKDKINGILEKIYQTAQPIKETLERTSGRITESEYSYRLLTVISLGKSPTKWDFNKIFRGKITWDRELRERTKKDYLENYVDSNIINLSR